MILFIFISLQTEAQTLRWTSFENLKDSLRQKTKPLMIFIYTDWCKFCKMQENITFNDLQLIELLNQKFYCLSLNAEENKEIIFLNKSYKFKSTGANTGVHALAELLGKANGIVSYPTTVFLNDRLQISHRMIGFQNIDVFFKNIKIFE